MKSKNHQRNSGQVELGNIGLNILGTQKVTLRVGVTMTGTLQIRIFRLQVQSKNFNMCLSVIGDSRIWVMSNTSNLCNLTDWIFHSELSHLELTPQHTKLLFLPITLQHVGIWSTEIRFLDARTALQAETKCITKERGSFAPWMRPESQWPWRAEKLTVDDLKWQSLRWQIVVDGFVSDHKGKVSVLIREQGQRLSSRRHLADGI